MSFDDVASRLKKLNQSKEEALAAAQPVIDPVELEKIRSRITGVLIRDARIAQGYSAHQLAGLMHVSEDMLVAWEFGKAMPSLPELELLAYWLEVPVNHFITSSETLTQQIARRAIDSDEYQRIRNRMIGAHILELRESLGYSHDYLSEISGIHPDTLLQYEYGQLSIPLGDLSNIADALRVTVSTFLEGNDRVGRFLQAQELFEMFLQMPAEVRQFVSKPANIPYIDLAMKLEKLGTEKLRGIAESILEITY